MQSSKWLEEEWQKFAAVYAEGADEEVTNIIHDMFFAGVIAMCKTVSRIETDVCAADRIDEYVRLVEACEMKRLEILEKLRDAPGPLNPAWLYPGRYSINAERN